ncbi:MAG: Putative DNA-binding protein [uncultured Campylobacterales bacterium]|uniref:DNA-binding protein n=1 Tax=uncultured Campylobacterales bacterium TaxID=352960 RepID=A0A6S6STW1_9BACT|nr:MAG: Putative DNA-binding protein [uncultured Campylobacterales bacterium]
MNIPFEELQKINELLLAVKALEVKVLGIKRWLNISETAHYLGYSKDRIHKLKNEYFFEGIHYYKKAGKLLFDKVQLDTWVMQSKNKIDPKKIVNNVLKDIL